MKNGSWMVARADIMKKIKDKWAIHHPISRGLSPLFHHHHHLHHHPHHPPLSSTTSSLSWWRRSRASGWSINRLVVAPSSPFSHCFVPPSCFQIAFNLQHAFLPWSLRNPSPNQGMAQISYFVKNELWKFWSERPGIESFGLQFQYKGFTASAVRT